MNNRSTKGNEMNFDEMYHNLMAESGVEYPRDEDYTTYFAYKGGESKKFNTRTEAQKFSSNIEAVKDKKALGAQRKKYYEVENEVVGKVIQAMKDDLGYDNSEEDKKVFDLIYSRAYEDGHSSGFNEVYNYLLDYDSFVKETFDIFKKYHVK
jgi:hypothetical protein